MLFSRWWYFNSPFFYYFRWWCIIIVYQGFQVTTKKCYSSSSVASRPMIKEPAYHNCQTPCSTKARKVRPAYGWIDFNTNKLNKMEVNENIAVTAHSSAFWAYRPTLCSPPVSMLMSAWLQNSSRLNWYCTLYQSCVCNVIIVGVVINRIQRSIHSMYVALPWCSVFTTILQIVVILIWSPIVFHNYNCLATIFTCMMCSLIVLQMVFNLGIFARKPKAYNKTVYLTKIIIYYAYVHQ